MVRSLSYALIPEVGLSPEYPPLKEDCFFR